MPVFSHYAHHPQLDKVEFVWDAKEYKKAMDLRNALAKWEVQFQKLQMCAASPPVLFAVHCLCTLRRVLCRSHVVLLPQGSTPGTSTAM